jgi:hypothetical protein
MVMLSANGGILCGRLVGYVGVYGLIRRGMRKGAKYGWRDTDVVAFLDLDYSHKRNDWFSSNFAEGELF